MKLSFSTRGWNYLSLEEVIEDAVDSRFNAIEIYNLFKNPDLTDRDGPFHPCHTAQTVRHLNENHLSISCFDTGIDLSDEKDPTDELMELIDKAHEVCCKYVAVRVNSDSEELVFSRIEKILSKIENTDITLLIKTCGTFADTEKLRNVLDFFASDNLAALWSVHHPCRENGESAGTTNKNLGAYVRPSAVEFSIGMETRAAQQWLGMSISGTISTLRAAA